MEANLVSRTSFVSTAMVTLRVMCFITTPLAYAHSLPVTAAFGFSPASISVGLHVQRQDVAPFSGSRLFASGDESPESNNGSAAGENNERRKGGRRQRNAARKRDAASAANSRAKMKKVNSSSRSKLLTPPSILSTSGDASDGRRWASSSLRGQNKGGKKRTPPQKESNRKGLKGGETSTPFPKGRKKSDGLIEGKVLSIPPFTSASDGGDSPSPGPSSSGSWEPVLEQPSRSPGGSLSDNQLELPHLSSSEPSLFGPPDFDFSSSAIEGVLPVSELFYRSTQSLVSSDNNNGIDENIADERQSGKENDTRKEEREPHDDEELPFSAEQSDQLSTPGNKVQIRRNKADGPSLPLGDIVTGMVIGVDKDGNPSEVVRRELTTMAEQEQEEQRLLVEQKMRMATNAGGSQSFPAGGGKKVEPSNKAFVSEGGSKGSRSRNRRSKSRPKANAGTGRKMVRRGMEMLVGGEPINADPPQRSIELNYYRKHPNLWARAVTTNSPDFGPLLHMHSAGKVETESIGLFCENFVNATQKWGICPDDLKIIASERWKSEVAPAQPMSNNYTFSNDWRALVSSLEVDVGEEVGDSSGAISSRQLDSPKGFGTKTDGSRGGKSGMNYDKTSGTVPITTADSESDPLQRKEMKRDDRLTVTLGGELKFSLGVSRSDLEYGRGRAIRRVLRDGIGLSINADEKGLDVRIGSLVITEVDGGSTDVIVQFQLIPRETMDIGEAERTAKEVNGALASAVDDGKIAMTLAHVAREEKDWTAKIRNRIVEDFLFENEDDDEEEDYGADDADADDISQESVSQRDEYDGPFGMEGDVIHAKDDIWLGGGNGGVFFDYSESNYLNSPYKGKVGPYLVDAVIERARQNQPRVIAVGDVHGCIDELKALLKKCDYHPGDTVVFLGDLVCKGPDSLSVVQMAREIGAIGVRGNHDFEVVRWHQAIKSGADPPVIGSEHYHVASALNTADLKWLYSLPWFISSSHLNALFVHAGFVSGIPLAKQNPRLMMNMRSILPDGTVTSKFFNNWPWARLWDGPQTVFFGHDADRGLQQYEHAIGLDTGCVYGGKLTACILPERRVVSVNAKREYFQYRRKHFD